MACPYFIPLERLENGSWPHPARLPLGGGWRGHCTAPGHEGESPALEVQEAFCNLGYASRCAWLPAERLWDAVRFAVSAPSASPGKAGAKLDQAGHTICLRYVRERNHRPVEHGQLEFELQQSTWLEGHEDPRVEKMAECFLQSYLRKKS